MALYLPEERLVLDVVDDPCSAPVERDAFPECLTVLVTCAALADILGSGRAATRPDAPLTPAAC